MAHPFTQSPSYKSYTYSNNLHAYYSHYKNIIHTNDGRQDSPHDAENLIELLWWCKQWETQTFDGSVYYEAPKLYTTGEE